MITKQEVLREMSLFREKNKGNFYMTICLWNSLNKYIYKKEGNL